MIICVRHLYTVICPSAASCLDSVLSFPVLFWNDLPSMSVLVWLPVLVFFPLSWTNLTYWTNWTGRWKVKGMCVGRTCPQALQWCRLLVMELNGSWHFIHRVTSFSLIGVGARFPSSTQLCRTWTQLQCVSVCMCVRYTKFRLKDFHMKYICVRACVRVTGEWGGVDSSSRSEQFKCLKLSTVCSCLWMVAWMAWIH